MWSFDTDEITQIVVSMVVVAIAFSLGAFFQSKEAFAQQFPIILVGVGTGFILHELAHKFVAIRFGAFARYQAWESGLVMALIMAVVTGGRFVFAAPGAVYIYSRNLTPRQNGLISVAGCLTNLVLGLAFVALALFAPTDYVFTLAATAASINFFLGAFNMIPIPPLDGSKVFAWNWMVWLALMAPLAFLAFFL